MAIKCRVRDAAMALGIQHATIEIEQMGEVCRLKETCTVEPCPPVSGDRNPKPTEKD
jgi:hypothetical protein